MKNTYHKIGASAPNGNLTADGYRGITSITYNPLNLPAKITYDATKYIELTYDASGRKWKKTAVDGSTTTEKYYFGPIEYNGSTLEALYHEEGRAVPDGNGGYDYEYAIRDHLGSTRVMFEMVNATATIIQESHTYPFGMELSGPTFVGGGNPYRYTGKEWEEDLDLGLYDYGARWYDPAAARWWGWMRWQRTFIPGLHTCTVIIIQHCLLILMAAMALYRVQERKMTHMLSQLIIIITT
ncbi:MAG: hypothetical protein SF052_09720 [Bacteroidia bacterium]|nr:hypothetical protein [Bacteroidia bacterium]